MAVAWYKLKSDANGSWFRVTGTASISQSGLIPGAVYEFEDGDGNIVDVTAGVDVIAAGAIADQTFDENDGVKTVDVSGDFTNADNYALQTAPAGVTINGGIVSIDTGATGTLSSSSIVVRGTTNTGTDFADSGFSVTVEASISGPVISNASISGNTLTLDSDKAGTFYLVLVPDTDTTPDGAQIIAGDAADDTDADFAGSNAITTGSNDFNFDLSGLNGDFKFCMVVQNSNGTSNVLAPVETVNTIAASPVDEDASTGTFESSNGYRIWTGTDTDTLVVDTQADFDAIIIGGGGDGGGRRGGGGGAGRYVPRLAADTNTLTLAAGSYAVSFDAAATSGHGHDTTFAGVTAIGGGVGGTRSANTGGDGGSGGGASSNTGVGSALAGVGLGSDGGPNNSNGGYGGGGGSATEAPAEGPINAGGPGGDGILSPVPGETSVRYCAGGGAGGGDDSIIGLGGDGGGGDGAGTTLSATAGQDGTGSGGGGGSDAIRTGASGGTGIVKIWWAE